jgi:hypothetical protein
VAHEWIEPATSRTTRNEKKIGLPAELLSHIIEVAIAFTKQVFDCF